MAFGSDELAREEYRKWLGRPWTDTVTAESRANVEAMLRDAASKVPPRWRHVESSVVTRCRCSRRVFGGAGRQRRPRRGHGPRPALGGRAPAAPGRSAAVDGARLLAAAPRRDALPAAVPDGLRGRADRRRGHAQGDRGRSRVVRAAGRKRTAHRGPGVPRRLRCRQHAGDRSDAGGRAHRRTRRRRERAHGRQRTAAGDLGAALPPRILDAVPGPPGAAGAGMPARGRPSRPRRCWRPSSPVRPMPS